MEMPSTHFLDRRRARVLVGFVALAALMAMAQIWMTANRVDPTGKPLTGEAAALVDPSGVAAFDRCKAERTADVDRLVADGLINAAQHADYRTRAIATCAGQFPPVKAQ
jgi:hypothetical protein